ncbi:Panacea domain-containing protein [Bacillus sp. FJAT-45350]|uniref:Panacea domain-containing protein n=1 Tax=Bacillus sp. FJAT-45350 TaxID=2011014 RepID=UPI000BB8E6E7|nr:type II toxin-antitoxin system antitoxin SocA domain-containing protein [Bacillus sp. FJAT-45350]
MASMEELYNHIIDIANKNNLTVTNLQIQKVMFFSLGMHIRLNNGVDDLAERTYNIPFEKWRYGPVVESIYYQLNYFKDKPIKLDGTYSHEYSEWDNIIVQLLNINVFELVRLSHKFPSWANYEDDINNRRFVESYTIDEIAEDFMQ